VSAPYEDRLDEHRHSAARANAALPPGSAERVEESCGFDLQAFEWS
jgi:hypothetical protein